VESKTSLFFLGVILVFGGGFLIEAVRNPPVTNPVCITDCKHQRFNPDYCQIKCSADPSAQEIAKRSETQCIYSCAQGGQSDDACDRACKYR
jgi:hypothetical protein